VGSDGTFGDAACAKKRDYIAERLLSFIITAAINKLLGAVFQIFLTEFFFRSTKSF
jgi:hypothetical protein